MLRKKTLALALAGAWGIYAPAWAAEQNQNSQETSEAVLKEVSVSAAPSAEPPSEATGSYTVRGSSAATGLDLSLRETPQSVSVITQEQMDDYRLTNANDVLDNATGIVVERVETDRTYYTARGSDVSNFQLDGIGLPLNFGLATGDIDTAVYDRIEVIRGANGLMSATGNPSATVNFVRKRPTPDFNVSVDVTGGSWSNYRLEGDVSGTLNEAGNLRGRFVAVQQDKNSYLDRYSHDKTVLYGILEADITDNTLLTIGHTYQKNGANGVLWGALPLAYSNGQRIHYDVSASSAADWAYWDSEDNRTFAELAHEFSNGWQTKLVLTHRKISEDGNMLYIYGTPDNDTDADLGTWPSIYVLDNEQWIADVYAKGPFSLGGREHELVVGASWSRSDIEEESRFGTSAFTAVSLEEVLSGGISNTTYPTVSGTASFRDKRSSVYAATHFNVTNRLNLIGGARMTSVESQGESYGVPHEYEHNNKVTPYAGIVYALDKIHSAYASYTGIFNPQTEVDINRQPLAPLEGKNYEVGIKSEWLNKKLNTSAAIFRTKQDNVAEYVGTIPSSVNDAYYRGVSAVAKGLEFDLAGEVTDRLKVQGGYTAMSLEDTDGEDIKTYTPRHLLNLTTTYRVPMVDKLKVGMSVKWRGDIHKDIGGVRVEQDSYALIDLMAAYEIDKRTTITLNIDNATDQKYLTSLMWDQSYYGTPRSASLTLSWKY